MGTFNLAWLNELEKANYAEKRHNFWFGEVEMAAMLAGTFAVPVGISMAGRTVKTDENGEETESKKQICFLKAFVVVTVAQTDNKE